MKPCYLPFNPSERRRERFQERSSTCICEANVFSHVASGLEGLTWLVDTLDRKEGRKSWLREADRGRKMEPENENKDSRRKKRRKKGDKSHNWWDESEKKDTIE